MRVLRSELLYGVNVRSALRRLGARRPLRGRRHGLTYHLRYALRAFVRPQVGLTYKIFDNHERRYIIRPVDRHSKQSHSKLWVTGFLARSRSERSRKATY